MKIYAPCSISISQVYVSAATDISPGAVENNSVPAAETKFQEISLGQESVVIATLKVTKKGFAGSSQDMIF